MYKYKYLYKYPSFYPEEHRDRRYFTSQAPPIKEGTPVEPVKANSFWEHVDKNGIGYGNFFFLYTGERMPYVGDLWDKRISAIWIAPRTRITLFTGKDYTSQISPLINTRPYTYTNLSDKAYLWKDLTKIPLTGPPPLVLGTWDKKTSSIKTFGV
jgi:hypothetical protein